jgi:two-component system sensor histidine kinase GlrK
MGSFRQLLLVAFMLIAALLGGTALRAVIILDRLMAQSSEEAGRALALTAAAQSLSARSAAMERAARQSLVLSDAVLRRRFEEELGGARSALQQMAEQGLGQEEAALWERQVDRIADLLDGPSTTALDRERAIASEFRELDSVNSRISERIQTLIAQRNAELSRTLDASRIRMTQQVVVTIALAVVLAVGLGVWLSRPFKRLEHAILDLGENRLPGPIHIAGPSDIRGVSQQLEWLRLRLTELDADKARFLRHVSHELKTPLAALREGVALLQDGVPGELNASQQEVVRILQQNAISLQDQIEALLRFNAAAFEARQLQRRKIDLQALLREQVEAQRLQWGSRGLSVRVQGPRLSLPIDAQKLGTAIANLLSNAIRFSPPGGAILLQLSAPPEGVRIDITDEGPGVAQVDRDHVFEPFYRGLHQPQDAVRGTGIGLSIVQEYVVAHGGRVELLSDSHGGHFRIELPHAT